MAEPHYGEGISGTELNRGTNAANRVMAQEALSGPSEGEPCGACKYLRRKCRGRCIFSPCFGTDQGSAKIAAVHKVLKLLSDIPPRYRDEAAATISYEAQARLSDPVYGCVSTVLALQQQAMLNFFLSSIQVTTLQAKITMLQSQLVNTGFSAYATAIAQQHEQQQPNFNVALQPAYSNNSSASTTNLMNMRILIKNRPIEAFRKSIHI